MKLLIFAVLIAAVIYLLPYIRVGIRRIMLAIKLSSLCERTGARLYKTHQLWLFGGSRGRACDFYIETGETVWSVKLFGMKRRTTELCFTDDRRYFIRSYIAFAAGMFSRVPLDSKKRELPAYDFRAGFRDEWYMKRFKPVLLVNPVCLQINYTSAGGNRIVGAGEILNDMYIYSSSRLISDIETEVSE